MKLYDLTLLTVTFNNNLMTGLMLKSATKQLCELPETIVIDNGTTQPVDEKLKSIVEVFDNTNNHVTGNYHQCSKNHCSAVDYALKNLIETKWCLLVDNDILFKPTVKKLLEEFDESSDCVGEIGWDDAPPERRFPYFCLINVEKFRAEKVSYFENDRCIGPGSRENGTRGPGATCWYKDTGCSFLEDIRNTWNIREIKLSDYIVHRKNTGYGTIDQNLFLNSNKELY